MCYLSRPHKKQGTLKYLIDDYISKEIEISLQVINS